MKKIIIALCLTFALISTTTIANADIFADVDEGHQYFEAIQYAKDSGIVEGYEDGYYRPENKINRAEFLKILLETKYQSELEQATGSNCFEDIAGDEWFAKYVCYGKKIGVVNGYDDGTFRAAEPINVIEALKILLETMSDEIWSLSKGSYYEKNLEELLSGLTETPSDTEGQWYEKYLMQIGYYSLILEDWNSFGQNLTRGEMAEIAYRGNFLMKESVSVQQPEDWEIVKNFVLENTDISEDYFNEHFEYVESVLNYKVKYSGSGNHYYLGHWPIGIADAVQVKYNFVIDDAEDREQIFEKSILLHNGEVIEEGDVNISFYTPDGFNFTRSNDFVVSSDYQILLTKEDAVNAAYSFEECVDPDWFFDLEGAAENLKLWVTGGDIIWLWAEPQGLSACYINAQDGTLDYFNHSLPD
ncbi:hypothetical protein GF354_06640 [Candidatus Peregrinibacteria bacterium]|nr:hypothetical protein [Candidatus Peregrinibacteria bacterium]